jgi:Tryptophan 2,3-dioxygenase (vermilion)
VHEHDREAHARLTRALAEPAIYDEVLAYLARQGFPVPAKLLTRDLREPYAGDPAMVEIWAKDLPRA